MDDVKTVKGLGKLVPFVIPSLVITKLTSATHVHCPSPKVWTIVAWHCNHGQLFLPIPALFVKPYITFMPKFLFSSIYYLFIPLFTETMHVSFPNYCKLLHSQLLVQILNNLDLYIHFLSPHTSNQNLYNFMNFRNIQTSQTRSLDILVVFHPTSGSVTNLSGFLPFSIKHACVIF